MEKKVFTSPIFFLQLRYVSQLDLKYILFVIFVRLQNMFYVMVAIARLDKN